MDNEMLTAANKAGEITHDDNGINLQPEIISMIKLSTRFWKSTAATALGGAQLTSAHTR